MISETEQVNDTRVLWEFLRKKSRLIILTMLAGALIAILFTFFTPKEYRSTGVVYPPSAPSSENSIDNPNFGYDVEADRLIQIFHSNEIRDSVVRRFDLYNYFEIPKDSEASLDKLVKKYGTCIRFERAPSMCVIITAQTYSPHLSADIVNYLIDVTDKVRERIYKQNIRYSFENAQKDFSGHEHRTDSMRSVLTKELKDNQLSSLLILASNAQLSIDMDKLTSKTNVTALDIGNDIIIYRNMLERLKESEGKLLRLKKILETPVPKMFVIDHAEPRFKKVWPSFFVNAAIGSLVALAILLAILIIRNNSELSKH
jgi:uncharacterized protein involved in exopolysaccharide biosynthesis